MRAATLEADIYNSLNPAFPPSFQLVVKMVESIRRVPGISAVLYDLTSKPPGTTEWEWTAPSPIRRRTAQLETETSKASPLFLSWLVVFEKKNPSEWLGKCQSACIFVSFSSRFSRFHHHRLGQVHDFHTCRSEREISFANKLPVENFDRSNQPNPEFFSFFNFRRGIWFSRS